MKCCECPTEVPATGYLCIQDNKVCCSEDCCIVHVNKTVLGVDLSRAYPEDWVRYVEKIVTKEIEQ